jgi:eukaryotic-like serine/threonine-protein kinase
MIGKTLGHYQIIEKLGQGGMGIVYKARDTHLDRFAAIKVLPAEKVADPERKRRFIQEAKAASALIHPSIITIYDIDEAEGIDFIAMEYVAGKTLDELIPRKGMRLSLALKYAVQIADALARAHGAGIIHRDLKPSNVMVDEHGLVKVLDFGLAKLTEAVGPEAETAATRTGEGTVLGTAAYMSPEQAEGKHIDTRSDIFSFGSMLYEMLTGQRAFRGDTRASTIASILREEPKPISQVAEGLPREVERIVRRCLRKDPEHRFQNMADLRVALEELKEESDSGALESAGVAGKAVRGTFWWVGGVTGMAVIVVALGIAGWFWLGRSHPTPTEARLTAVPLTSYRGSESFPSFSPDETQVAFQWCQEGQKCHIYIKQIGVEPPFQLTNAAAGDYCPAWSPDGRFIAFVRVVGPKKVALIVIPQRGGPERQLETWDVSKMSDPLGGPYLAWTPDSKWLAFPYLEEEKRIWALFLISLDTGEKRRLTTPPVDVTGDTRPAPSPDGRILAFSRDSMLYLLQLGEGYKPQGEPKRADTGNLSNLGAVWTPDGREIVFSSGGALWRMEVSKPGKQVRVDLASDNAGAPSISRSGKRLAYSVERFDTNIWRVDLEGPDRKPGKPVQLIFSTKPEYCPASSPDGKRIAFVSEQTGTAELWICDSNGRNHVQLTSLGAGGILGPRWSPDGQSIAFYAFIEKEKAVYVVGANGGTPQRLAAQSSAMEPSWSRDGRWLYFAGSGIWKIPSKGGEAIQVIRTEDVDIPQQSPDGKFLYFCRGFPFSSSVWRIPVEGGEEAKVLDSVHSSGGWAVRQEGIFFFTTPDDRGLSELCVYEFASGKTSKILRMEKGIEGRIAVSPDGNTILYAQVDEAGSDLMLVENFR